MSGMRMSLILSAVGEIVAAGAVLFFMEKPAAYYIALALLLVPGGMYLLFFRPFLQGADLEQRGQPAAATVLEMWDTGWTVNENPQVGLRLQVRPAGDPPYEAKTKMVLSRLLVGQLRPGTVLQVRYDPKNPQRVVVDTSAELEGPAAAAGPSRAAQRMAELEDLRRRDLVSEEEYERKRREILEQL